MGRCPELLPSSTWVNLYVKIAPSRTAVACVPALRLAGWASGYVGWAGNGKHLLRSPSWPRAAAAACGPAGPGGSASARPFPDRSGQGQTKGGPSAACAAVQTHGTRRTNSPSGTQTNDTR